MKALHYTTARVLERALGRRRLVRTSRFLLNHARRDGPNDMRSNGEQLVQEIVVRASQPEATVFDVGANVGQWSSQLLRQPGAIDLHVFEPSESCMARLRTTLVSDGRVTVSLNQWAASSVEGSATLFKPHELAGSSSLHSTTDTAQNGESIRTRTLADYCEERGITHVDLLKVDAEGHDLQVLTGARLLFEQNAISIAQFEYNHRWIYGRSYLKDVFDLLRPFGYAVGKVTAHGIEWYPGWSPDLETFIEANYVAALPEFSEALPATAWWNHV